MLTQRKGKYRFNERTIVNPRKPRRGDRLQAGGEARKGELKIAGAKRKGKPLHNGHTQSTQALKGRQNTGRGATPDRKGGGIPS